MTTVPGRSPRTPLPAGERVAEIARVRRRVARLADSGQTFLPGESILVAVSGGQDSVTLLDALARLAPPRRWRLVCVHVDHGLREGSAAEASVVEKLATGRRIQFEAVRADLPEGGSLQDRARQGRYAALAAVAEKCGATAIALGHTADDQAETVLWRVLSGAPPASLAGMPLRAGPQVRPLLTTWRGETAAYCAALGVVPLDDPANSDPRHLRTRLRREALPLLEQILPGARKGLVGAAARQRAELVMRASSEIGSCETPC